MFGLSEQEMEQYKNMIQNYAVMDVTPMVVGSAKFITPIIEKEDKAVPDTDYVNKLVTDIETVITLVSTHMAYDYAFLQSEPDIKEEEIVTGLHKKYETILMNQFFKYGVSFNMAVLNEILSELILELPYLYMSVIEDENFDDDQFLEDKLEAYEKYLENNFSEEGDDDEED